MKYLTLPLILMWLLGGCAQKPSGEGGHEEVADRRTVWTEKAELFVEFTGPRAGKASQFLLHLTALSSFKPATEGPLVLTFAPPAGEPLIVRIDAPARPGIFKADLIFPNPGKYTMKAVIAGKALSDEITVKDIEVQAGNEISGKRADPQGEGQLIAFSKEQQWRIDFRAEKPARRPVSAPFPVTGELIPVSNSEVTISAPLAGILSVSKRLPYVGQKVEADELLAQIDPAIHQPGGIGQLTAAYSEAKNRAALAQKEYDRAKRLYAGKAAPQRRVEEAELALDTANAALDPLEKAMQGMKPGTSENRILVRAPFRATVVELMASNGKAVEAGQPLMRLVDTTTLWLRANIPVTEIAKLRRFDDVTFAVAGAGNGHRPSRLVAVNDVVDPRSRTVPVIFEVANPKGRLKAGMFADLSIATGRAEHGLTVPDGALFEDEGRFFVFVQREGELFVRREVSVGTQGNGYAQINGGIREDERVVTKGGYYVKLASLSARTQQGHGHDH